MSRKNVDPKVVERVIGDVIDVFEGTVSMDVYFGSKHITNGCQIKPSIAVNPPNVIIGGQNDKFYTLVMTDPDAPSPSDPTLREWIHWIVTDIPGGTDATQGQEVFAYMGPRPTAGIHRYIVVLFEQKKAGIGQPDKPFAIPIRSNFCTRNFAHHFQLDPPVATVYFNAQKEPATDRRRTAAA